MFLVLLSFFEEPAYTAFRDIPDNESSNLPTIPSEAALLIQLALYLVIAAQLYFEYAGGAHVHTRFRRSLEAVVVTISVISTVVVLALRANAPLRDACTFATIFAYASPFLRALLYFSLPFIRRVGKPALIGWSQISTILLGLLMMVVFVSWIIIMLVADLDMTEEQTGAFYTFRGSMYELAIMWAAADVPDGFLPFLREYRAFGFLFYPFLGIIIFGFTNVCLAIIYKGYQTEIVAALRKFYANRTRGVALAYYDLACPYSDSVKMVGRSGVLVSPRTIAQKNPNIEDLSLDIFLRLSAVIDSMPTLNADPEKVHHVFRALDTDKSGCLSLTEFLDVTNMLQYDFNLFRKNSWLMDNVHRLPNPQGASRFLAKLQDFIHEDRLTKYIDFILIINGMLVVYESYLDFLHGNGRKQTLKLFEKMEFAFSCVYIGEIFLKLSVSRWDRYWARGANRFDFVISILLFVSSVGPVGKLYRRYFNIVRSFRLLRLVGRMKAFALLSSCIVSMFTAAGDVLLFVFGFYYLYACVGVSLFGGMLSPADPRLADTDYITSGYELLNFNDFTTAMLTLFNMMICAYIREIPDALAIVASSGSYPVWLPPVFFYSWYLVAGILCFNIFVSFAIDVFLTLQEEGEKEKPAYEDRFVDAAKELWDEGWVFHVEMSSALRIASLRAKVFEELDTTPTIEEAA